MKKNIEIEYRVRIAVQQFETLRSKLAAEYEEFSHTRRLSFMAFFKHDDKQFDARVRITNGEAELVFKIGALHSDDRTEMSQPITPDQLVGLARMMSYFGTDNYIAERETYNFGSPDKTLIISLARADKVAYIEYELQDNSLDEQSAKQKLLNVIETHGFEPLDEAGFKKLNKELDAEDWQFSDKQDDVFRLEELLKSRYI